MKVSINFKSVLSLSVVALMMTACSGSGEVQEWITQQKAANQAKPPEWDNLPTDNEKKVELYTGGSLISPMDQSKLYSVLVENTYYPSCIQTQIDRKRDRPEPLEAYPLDLLKAVGYIKATAGSKAMALIQVSANQKYEVYVGQYIGLDYGRVTGISENEIHITETLHLPGSDACEERDITLNIYGGVN